MQSNSAFSGQRILVTGGSGFIGSRLCARLLDLGADVHAVSRTAREAAADGPRWWQGDLAEIETVRALLDAIEPNMIFHLASHVTGKREVEQVIPTLRSNLMSLVNVMAAASERRCERIVSCGSIEEPVLDAPDAVPVSPYAAAKWASGVYARLFHAHYRLPVVHLRVSMVYGPGHCEATRIVPYVIRSLLAGDAPKLSSGDRQVDWLYAGDAIEGMLAAATAAGVEGCSIDLGSGELVTVRAIVERIANLVGARVAPLYGALPDRPFERPRAADVAETHARIGWRPTTPLDEGLRATIAWYRERRAEQGA